VGARGLRGVVGVGGQVDGDLALRVARDVLRARPQDPLGPAGFPQARLKARERLPEGCDAEGGDVR
jgi:hypothetical protein